MPKRNLREIPKIRDSLSYLYVEYASVEREGSAVAIKDANGETHVPAAALAALMLGPGTSVTHEGVKVLTDSGCSVLWVGQDGVRLYAHGLGGTRSSRRLLRQAELHADPERRSAVVYKMYAMRFDDDVPAGLTIQQLRGREGVRVREAYRAASDATGVAWHGRNYDRSNWMNSDEINRAISAGSACLNGVCHAAILAAGYSPALGFVHTGKQLSFVYDIADLYKMTTVVPAAFEATAAKQRGELEGSLEREVRIRCRDFFRAEKIMKRIVRDLDRLTRVDEEEVRRAGKLFDGELSTPGFLWDPRGHQEGGKNYDPDLGPEGPDESQG